MRKPLFIATALAMLATGGCTHLAQENAFFKPLGGAERAERITTETMMATGWALHRATLACRDQTPDDDNAQCVRQRPVAAYGSASRTHEEWVQGNKPSETAIGSGEHTGTLE